MRAKGQARKLEQSEGESDSDFTSSGDSVRLESDSLEDQGDGEGVEDSVATSVAMETPSKLTHSNSSIGGLMPSSLYVLDQSIMPSELYLGQSQCPSQEVTVLQRLGLGLGLTLGVWTKVKIPSGTHFGPFIGKIRPLPLDRQFAWEIAQVADVHGSCSMWVDATEPGIGNWMKYVRAASHLSLRNMKAVLLNSQVYYRATKDICEGEELLLKDRKLIPGGQKPKSHQEDVTSSSVVPATLPESKPTLSETLIGGPAPSFSSPSSINNNNNDNSKNNNNNNNESGTPSSTSILLHQRPEVEKEERNPPQSPPVTSPLLLPPGSSATKGVPSTTALQNHSPNSNSSGSEGGALYLGQRRQGQRAEGEENDAEDEDEDDDEEEEDEEEEEDDGSITPRSSHNEDSKPLTNILTSADSNEAEFKDRFLHGLECAACCQSFSDVAKLEEHLVLVHYARESGLGEYKCDQCPKIFSWKSNLLRHQSTHEDGRRYNCENCHKIFTDPSNLQRHIRSQHIGARSHACPECGKTFATSSGLKQHTHIHSSVKPFQCEVCLKSYTQFSNLCRHKRMHADCRMQIKCHKCGQAFSTVTSLSKHKRFCEGPSLGNPSAPLTNGGCGLLNLANQGPNDGSVVPPSMNLSHPAQLMFYPRPGFPFYPPSMVAYPMFPGASAIAPHPSLVAANSNLYMQTTSTAKKPDSPDSSVQGAAALNGASAALPTSKQEVLGLLSHKEKRGSEGSESEISDELSSAGASDDVDVSTGSELDSESDAGERRGLKSQAPKKLVSNAMPNLFVPRRENSPKQGATYPSDPALKGAQLPANGLSKQLSVNCDMPFDLSVNSKVGHMSPASERNGKDEEQPLDLRVNHKRSTPHADHGRHKTHVFGEHHKVKEERLMTVAPPPHEKLPSMIAPPQAVANVPVFSEPPPSPTKFPMACPRPIHPLMMEALYRMDKPKFPGFPTPERMIPAFPARYPFLSPLMNLNGSSAALDILRSQMEKMGKPYHDVLSPHMNKLKERYSCKFCGKIFPRSANLTRHLRTHTGEQPYKCKYCERSFSISSNLQRHVRNIHNKEKPFKCPLCDRCFGQQTNLDRHLKKHESDGPTILDDSPKSSELNDKDDTYFDEIRNFIGKVTERDTATLIPSQVLGGPLYEKMDCNNPPSRTPEHLRPILKTERMDDNDVTDDEDDVKPSPVKRRHVSSEGEGMTIRSPSSCNDGELPMNGLKDSKSMAYEAMMKVSKRHPKGDEQDEEENFRKRRNVHRMESMSETQSEDGKDAPLKTEA